MEFRFFELLCETTTGSKKRLARKMADKITVFDCGEGNEFKLKLSGGPKNRARFEESQFHCTEFRAV